MNERSGKASFSYGWALLAVVTVAAGRTLLPPPVSEAHVLLLLVPIVALVSWVGGVGPGLFATLLSAASAVYQATQRHESLPEELIGLGFFILTSAMVIAMTHFQRKATEPSHTPVVAPLPAIGERDSRLKEVFDSTWDVAIVVMDRSRIIREFNPGACQLTGYSRGEAIGRSADELFPPEDVVKGDAKREQSLAEATGKAPIARWLRRKDGRAFYADGMMRPTCNSVGELSGFIKVFVDGTQRLKANRDMEQLFLDRAEEIKRLNYSMAHDMRQYARGMSVNLAAIRHDLPQPLDPEVETSLERLQWNARAMSDMVDGMIEYLRLGQTPVNPKPVNLSVLASQVAVNAAPDLDFQCQPDLWVKADPDLLRDLLLNLLSNAMKYGGGKAWLGRDEASKSFYIRDEGDGFTEEQADRIFTPFVRLHDQSNYGIGLGLPSAKRIAEVHGGTMTATSEGPGKGATFFFTLSSEEPASPNDSSESPRAVANSRSRTAVVSAPSVGARL